MSDHHRLRHRSRRTAALLGAVLAIALIGTGCGTTEKAAESAPQQGAPAGPVTVTDSRGKEIKLEKPATRVVALEWGEAESLVSLGAGLVGVADKKGFATWDKAVTLPAGVKDVGVRGEPSIDSIVALQPDLVVANGADGATPMVTQIEKYVPVLLTKGADASDDWARLQGDVLMMATATGTEAKGNELLQQMDTTLAEGKTAIAAAGNGGRPFLMADGWKEGSTVSIRMFAEGSEVSVIGERLGLVNAWKQKGDKAWGLGQTDVEGLSGYKDPELHFFYSASEDDVFADGLDTSKIWTGLPFVQEGNLTHFTPGTWTFGGPASVIHIAEQMIAALTA